MNISSSTSSSTDYSRITGLATGMDTDAMVKQAVAGDQAKIDSVLQSKQILEWQQEAYVDIIKDLKSFQSSYLDILGTSDTNMMLSTAYNGTKASSTDENVLKVTTLPNAIKADYKIHVDQLASGATESSNEITDMSELVGTGSFKITVSGVSKPFTITTTATTTGTDLLNALKSATNDDKQSILNYVDINYSELTKKISITNKQTGDTSTLKIEDVSGNVATDIGLTTTGTVTGLNAIVDFKTLDDVDIAVDKNFNSNSFTIDGMKFDLLKTGDSVVSIKPDATDSVAKIKKFVEAYNTLIEKINTKITEKKNYDYKPLTDAQKEEMSEDDISKWETQAKKGLLSRDNTLTNMLSQMRQAIYETVEGAGLSISDIGISTTSNYKDGGKLTLDEEKLKSALETRSDQVYKLFTQSSDVSNEKGILQKFKDLFNNNIGTDGTLIKKAGYEDSRWSYNNQLSKSIEEKENRITRLQDILYDKQTRYYSMFAALEKNMNNLNSQSNWLYSQLGTA